MTNGAPGAGARAPGATTDRPEKPCQSFTCGWAGAGGPAVRLRETNPKDSSDATSPEKSKDRRVCLRTGGRCAGSRCLAPRGHAHWAGACPPGPGGPGPHAGHPPDNPHRPPRTSPARERRNRRIGPRCGQGNGRPVLGNPHRLKRLPRHLALLQLIIRCAAQPHQHGCGRQPVDRWRFVVPATARQDQRRKSLPRQILGSLRCRPHELQRQQISRWNENGRPHEIERWRRA